MAFPAFESVVLTAAVAAVTEPSEEVAWPVEDVALAALISVAGSKLAIEDWSSVNAWNLVSAIVVAKPAGVQYLPA